MGWPEQKNKLAALNLFYSSVKDDSSKEGIISQGYESVGSFIPVPDSRNNVVVRPDFTFYENEAVIFVHIEYSDTINNDHKRKSDDYDKLNLEGVREFIKKKGRANGENLSAEGLELFDSYFVFPEATIEKAESGGPGASALDYIRENVATASQSPSSTLQYRGGLARVENFHSILDDGIHLPDTADIEYRIPAEIKPESVVVALSQEILLDAFKHQAEVTMTPVGVRESLGREIADQLGQKVLEYLAYKGLCKRENEYEYTFDRANSEDIMKVEEDLIDESVDEYLNQQGGWQASVEDF